MKTTQPYAEKILYNIPYRETEITTENRAQTDTVSRTIDQHINEVYEKHFSLTFEAIDPTGADDYFFYLKNTGTKNIHITKARYKSTVTGAVELHYVTGTASSTTAVTPVNRYIGSSKTITATAGTAADITGLTNGGVLSRYALSSTDTDFVINYPAHVILPPGQAIALLWDTSTGVLAGTIELYEDQGIV